MKVTCFLAFMIGSFLMGLTINTAYSQEAFTVRTIYIKPYDVNYPSPAKLKTISLMVNNVQEHYRNEMVRHGYGDKTFKTENGIHGLPEITVIKSNKPKSIYQKSTSGPAQQVVLEQVYKGKNNLYIIVVGGIDLVDGKHGGIAGIDINSTCAGCRGVAVLVDSPRSLTFSIMAHEVGHLFGLSHVSHAESQYLMGNRTDKFPLTYYEAHWLDMHPYFNNRGHILNDTTPFGIHVNEPKFIGKNWVFISANVESINGIHQAQLVVDSNFSVIAFDIINGRRESIEFLFKREDLPFGSGIWLHFIDSDGKLGRDYFHINLPDSEVNIQAVKEAESALQELGSGLTYLTLTSTHRNAKLPFNKSWQWGHHTDYVWEKTPEGRLTNKPAGAVPIEHYLSAYSRDWVYWFYSHANSFIMWQINDKNYDSFQTSLYLPNPCNGVASFEVTFYVDWVEAYKLEVTREDQNTHISFDIPQGTRFLILEVFELEDPGCDHYLLANTRLSDQNTFASPQRLQNQNMVTTWAGLKR